MHDHEGEYATFSSLLSKHEIDHNGINFTYAVPVVEQHHSLIIIYFTQCDEANCSIQLSNIPAQLPLLLITDEKLIPSLINKLSDGRIMDFLPTPLHPDLLHRKIIFLKDIHTRLHELTSSKQKIHKLEDTISNLHRSVEGHNTFLDLMSKRDGLTGLFNRRHFNSVIRSVFADCDASKGDISLLVINIDYFSEINKSCGQDFGDFVLNELAARMTSCCGDDDICFRLSGEEFAMVMLAANIEQAMDKAEMLRSLCQSKIYDNGNFKRTVTISIGAASYCEHKPRSHDEFILMADQALFLAKSEGRNKVMQHTPLTKSSFGTSEQNFKILQDTVTKILEKTKISTIRSLQLLAQGLMETQEADQVEHAQHYAQILSEQLGLTPAFIDTFRNSIILLSSIRFLLHNEMINKKGALTHSEWEILSDFPYKLDQITNLFDYFAGERTILLHHGEKYDGTGYPEGLKGDEIPVGARIFSLISAVAAMSTDRPYRKKLPPETILTELSNNAGSQFDPHLVLKLIDVIEEKGILPVSKESFDQTRDRIRNSIL